mgnify:CR=1 FL=1
MKNFAFVMELKAPIGKVITSAKVGKRVKNTAKVTAKVSAKLAIGSLIL